MNKKQPSKLDAGRKRRKKSPFRLALEVYDRIEKIHEELLKRRSGEPEQTELPLDLALTVHTGKKRSAERKEFATRLLSLLDEDAERRFISAAPFREGRVYCYWCETAHCSHAAPPTHLTVFSGYNQTGLPCWEDLSSCFLRINESRVHLLHEEPFRPITLFMSGKSLHGKQFPIFGAKSKIFRIVCQTAVGYIPYGHPEDPYKLALTLQVVESRLNAARTIVELNVLGRTREGRDMVEEIETRVDGRITDLVEAGRRNLHDIAKQRPGRERYERMKGCLKHVAAGIEKIFRQKGRRTKHAEFRHRDRTRPAGAALKDTERGTADHFFLDQRRRTTVVLGPRCRTHFFSEDGKHVTSIVYSGEEIDKFIQTSQWKKLPPEQVEAVKKTILH